MYSNSIEQFMRTETASVVGQLTYFHGFDTNSEQADAWAIEIELLKEQLINLQQGTVFIEFMIPRMGRRADAVIILAGSIFVIEFKVGANHFDIQALEQAYGYALDLKYFHKTSHLLPIVPVVIATDAPSQIAEVHWDDEAVAVPIKSNGSNLGAILQMIQSQETRVEMIDAELWADGRYYPSPTIVQAAQALYAGHDVADITRSEADEAGLRETSNYVQQVIHSARLNREKAICFVTGVPGAGKTLVGLNIATATQASDAEHAVYLSGNGPLVSVLQEALARDESGRLGCRKSTSYRRAAAYVQNIHHFRDEYVFDSGSPAEQVVIFDEAQRAWNREQTSKFMRTKKRQPGFDQSEPEFLISVMDRHDDWAVIVALVGGGQEINAGEAGLDGWLRALNQSHASWSIYLAPEVEDPTSMGSAVSLVDYSDLSIEISTDLHLKTSQRSFRTELISEGVHHLVHGDSDAASKIFRQTENLFPITVTRDLEVAKAWVREHRKATESSGLLASSKGYRLLPEGIFVKNKIDPAVWFLNETDDVRSCHALELVGTEFDVQGLELDWTIVAWDADYRWNGSEFEHWKFSGTKWQHINKRLDQDFLRNAYRVLLTRARQGMIIFVPHGTNDDPTRNPDWYASAASYLKRAGLKIIT
ncbi:DUF2075 domain-containing protein [Crystallibacter degradans]|uniref:DUF2075 domain-containing protein n=1 Tax=Crystallibacter degradans TaxID=2726743 RepID=UPI00197BD7F1|nr:DUF2075 domain-containing protein [Arthrobacter sp. SF27]